MTRNYVALMEKVKVVQWLMANELRLPELTVMEALEEIREQTSVDLTQGRTTDSAKQILRNIRDEAGIESSFRRPVTTRRVGNEQFVELQEGLRSIAHVLTVVVKELGLVEQLNGHFDRLYQISRRGIDQGEEVTS